MAKTVTNFTKNISNSFSGFRFVPFGKNGVEQLYKTVTTEEFIDQIIAFIDDPSNAISSMRVYPIKLNKFEPSITGSYDKYMRMVGRDWEIKNSAIKPSFIIQVTKPYTYRADTWLDYEPYTHIQMYLPYLDYVDLPVNEIIGHEIVVYYAIDLSSGTATAYIECNGDNGKYIIATKTGKIGVDIAFGSTNNAENTRNILNTILTTAITVYSIGATAGTSEVAQSIATVGKATALSKGALSIMNSMQLRYQRGGNNGSLGSMYSPSSPYLIIKKQIVNYDPLTYAGLYGLPLYQRNTLSTFKGYTVVDEIHLSGFPNATNEELTEIEQLLKTGVHL